MTKFFRRGISKIYWLPSVATPSAGPTSGEITAGTDLSPGITEVNGFSIANAPIATPTLDSRFTKSIPGEDTTDDSSLVMFDDDTTQTLRSVLAKDTVGYIALLPYGLGTGKRVELWNVTITGNNDQWTTDNEAARFMVSFSINEVPYQNAELP